jgi:hypothetical protein
MSRSIATSLALAMLTAAPAFAEQGVRSGKVSFYVVAHQDDWQLLMNPAAFEDVMGGAKTVFVHTTAGDAGLGTGRGGRKHPYYRARENGAEAAVRFMADADGIPAVRAVTRVTRNKHALHRVGYRNTVSYFLRLPDGSGLGTGYPKTKFQSLKRLADGNIGVLSAIDGSAAYRGWNDLVTTLRAILDFERGRAPQVQISVSELDAIVNPDDHPDHLSTAKAALDAAAHLGCARRVHYQGYVISQKPENLTGAQRDMKSAVFGVTLAGVLAFDHRSTFQYYDQRFVGRTYFRAEEGSGPCAAG